jgi:hypothetical protein
MFSTGPLKWNSKDITAEKDALQIFTATNGMSVTDKIYNFTS